MFAGAGTGCSCGAAVAELRDSAVPGPARAGDGASGMVVAPAWGGAAGVLRPYRIHTKISRGPDSASAVAGARQPAGVQALRKARRPRRPARARPVRKEAAAAPAARAG